MLNAKLVIDLGNSETRAVLRVGDLHNNSRKEHVFSLSNRFAIAYDGYPDTPEYTEENSTVFEIGDHKVGKRDVIGGTYVNGLMCEAEFGGILSKPTASMSKYNSEYTLLSTLTAIQKASMWIHKYFAEKQGQDVTLEEIINQVSWDINLLLPPSQVEKGGEVLAKSLVGKFNVNYQLPKANAMVTIEKVTTYSEGVMAYMAVLIRKSDKQLRPDKKFMVSSNVLVVDIGAGTTDIVLVRSNIPVENSKHTINYGGNNIKGKLIQKLNKENNFDLPDSYYDSAVVEGTIKKGNKVYDVTKELSVSKREVAQLINNNIQSFLESANLPLQTVEYVLVVGGGSISSPNPSIEPISKYILHGLQQFSSDMELIDIGDITDQEGVSINESDDRVGTRDLNVVGAEITLDLKELKEAQQVSK